MQPAATDNRSAQTIMRQWEKLQSIKNRLIRMGELSGDASPTDVIQQLRTMIPADLFQPANKS